MDYGGCSLKRDAIDARIVNEARTGTSAYKGSVTGKVGLIDTPNDVGGHLTYSYLPAQVLTDTDNDGMPDSWESANGLNPNSSLDAPLYTLNTAYTNIEVYINSIISSITTNQSVGAVSTGINEFQITSKYLVGNIIQNGNIQLKSHENIVKLILYNLNGRIINQITPTSDNVSVECIANLAQSLT
jgi:hypothetical protein